MYLKPVVINTVTMEMLLEGRWPETPLLVSAIAFTWECFVAVLTREKVLLSEIQMVWDVLCQQL